MENDNPSIIEDVKNDVVNDSPSTEKDDKATGLLNDLKAERKKRQEYEKKLKEIEETELLKKGETEKVLNQIKAELEALKKEKERADSELSEWNTYKTKERERYKSILGDVPNLETLPLETLAYLASKVNSKIPDTDISKPEGKSAPAPLTEEQKKEARMMFSGVQSEKRAYELYAEVMNKKNKK